MKEQPTEWENVFTNRISNKRLIFKIYKDLLKFSRSHHCHPPPHHHHPIKKQAKDLNGYFSKEEAHMAKGYVRLCSTITKHHGHKN